MGLHRDITVGSNVSSAEVENRRRVWWTVYIFDSLISSRLGHPMISDGYIDVPFPSQNNLSAADEDDFFDPMQLIANIRLCRITRSILSLIYAGPSQGDAGNFVRNVHTILNQLKELDAELPTELKLDHTRFPAYGSRSVASLRLHFNQVGTKSRSTYWGTETNVPSPSESHSHHTACAAPHFQSQSQTPAISYSNNCGSEAAFAFDNCPERGVYLRCESICKYSRAALDKRQHFNFRLLRCSLYIFCNNGSDDLEGPSSKH